MTAKPLTQLDQLIAETKTKRTKDNIDFLSLFRDAPDRSPHFLLPTTGPIADAIAEVLAYNTATKKEMGILISKDGKRVERALGDESKVSFTAKQLKSFDGGTIVHNHPGPQPLSDQDSLMAASNHLKIWAASDDGGFSSSHGFNMEHLPFPLPGFATQVCMSACATSGGFFHAFKEKKIIDEDQYQALLSQFSNLLLAESDYLRDYRYRIGSRLKDAIEAVKNHAKDVWEATYEPGTLKKVGT